MKNLDRVTNIAVLIAVVIFLLQVGRGQFIRRPVAAPTTAKNLIGKTIRLPGLRLTAGHESLVLAISTTCHFCSDSLPFYKELSAKASGRLDVIAVLPQPQPEAERFLQAASVHTTQIVSARLDTLAGC